MLQVNIGNAFKLGETSGGISDANAGYQDLGSVISNILPNVMVVANLVLFFFILLGGFKLITSAGNPDQQKQGAQTIQYALIGFAVVFGAYWIMQLLRYFTGVDFLSNTV